MAKRRLPVGIQTFRIIREEGFYYVDKTGYARKLLDGDGKHYFLSRPRRFGKSLFVDTLKEFFQGSEELFRGLAVHDGWNWSRSHSVVRLSFGGGNYGRPGQLLARMAEQLADLEREAGVPASEGATPAGRFARLLAALHRQSGRRVVVLVDEYDKPILDAVDDAETARANRDDLRGLYGTIKDCDAHIELTFITGVSKFSKVSLFSDLNNLTDLTLDPAYSAICGYTEADLDTVFAAELPGLDRERIRAWYNGYNWLGEEKLYNPFGILKLFASRRFRAHWFETATPRFLIDTLLKHGFAAPDLESVRADEDLLSAFDADAMAPEALLFQTGYLTIAAEEGGCRRPSRVPSAISEPGGPTRPEPRPAGRAGAELAANHRERWARCAGCWRRRIGPAWRSCSGRCWPGFPTTGTAATTSPATRGTGRACSMPGSRPPWTGWSSRTPPATAGWTWPCSWPATRTCSSSRSPSVQRRERRWHSSGSGAMPTSIALPADPST